MPTRGEHSKLDEFAFMLSADLQSRFCVCTAARGCLNDGDAPSVFWILLEPDPSRSQEAQFDSAGPVGSAAV